MCVCFKYIYKINYLGNTFFRETRLTYFIHHIRRDTCRYIVMCVKTGIRDGISPKRVSSYIRLSLNKLYNEVWKR